MKDRNKLYGQLIVHCANAETQMDLYLILFEDIKKIFNFSGSFADMSRSYCLLVSEYISSLTSKERGLFRLFLAMKELIEVMNDMGGFYDHPSFPLRIINCDYEEKAFIVVDQRYIMTVEGGIKPKPFTLAFTDERFSKINIVGDIEKICEKISILKNLITELRFSEINKLSEKFVESTNISDTFILGKRIYYKNVVDEIYQVANIYESKFFHDCLSAYNSWNIGQLKINVDGSITSEPSFEEDDFANFFHEGRFYADNSNYPFLNPVVMIFNHCLIEFLKIHGSDKRLMKCKECLNYFIIPTRKEKKFCSDKCRSKFHNRKRIESGEHAEYKRKKRQEGAKESYYG